MPLARQTALGIILVFVTKVIAAPLLGLKLPMRPQLGTALALVRAVPPMPAVSRTANVSVVTAAPHGGMAVPGAPAQGKLATILMNVLRVQPLPIATTTATIPMEATIVPAITWAIA